MGSYSLAVVVAVPVAVLVDLLIVRTRLLRQRGFWAAYAIVVVFQLLVNGLLTATPVVRYDPDAIVGLRVAAAPVEDLGYGFALVLLTMSVWTANRPSGRRSRGPRQRSDGER